MKPTQLTPAHKQNSVLHIAAATGQWDKLHIIHDSVSGVNTNNKDLGIVRVPFYYKHLTALRAAQNSILNTRTLRREYVGHLIDICNKRLQEEDEPLMESLDEIDLAQVLMLDLGAEEYIEATLKTINKWTD